MSWATVGTFILAALKAIAEAIGLFRDSVLVQAGEDKAKAETNDQTAKTEHEMAKVDATPSTPDTVADSLRDGKF